MSQTDIAIVAVALVALLWLALEAWAARCKGRKEEDDDRD